METLPIPTLSISQSSGLTDIVRHCSETYSRRWSVVEGFVSALARKGLAVGKPSSKNPLEQPWKLYHEAAFLRRIRARGEGTQNWAVDLLRRVRSDTAALTAQAYAIERQIDQLVYGLYGLTDAEIAVVESAQAHRTDEDDEATTA